jgi:hypothetical protein
MYSDSFLLELDWSILLGLITATLLALTVGACGTTDSTIYTVDAIVYGKVQTASGEPVDGATVTLTHHPEGCDSPDVDSGRDFTDSTGHFRAGLPIASAPPDETSCFQASVDPPDGNGLAAPEPKQFSADFRPNPPYDSVRVDFALDSLSTQ